RRSGIPARSFLYVSINRSAVECIQFEQAMLVVWWGSVVEVHSAVERLHRERQLNDEHRIGALRRLRALGAAWREVLPDNAVPELAAEILAKYPLRAADSLQLAAAMAWRPNRATPEHSFRETSVFAPLPNWRVSLFFICFRAERYVLPSIPDFELGAAAMIDPHAVRVVSPAISQAAG